MKIDPLAVYFEARPGTEQFWTNIREKKWKVWSLASIVANVWDFSRPVNIYEVHAGLGREIQMVVPYNT